MEAGKSLCQCYSKDGRWFSLDEVYRSRLVAAVERAMECHLPRTLCRCRRLPWLEAAAHVSED